MVKKGVGYAIEGIIAITTLVIFALGTVQVPPNQDWTEFRNKVTTEDMTMTIQKTGNAAHFIQKNETGSLKTTLSTIAEIDTEVSGKYSFNGTQTKFKGRRPPQLIHTKVISGIHNTSKNPSYKPYMLKLRWAR